MKFPVRKLRVSIGEAIVQVAIIAYLFFAIDTECRSCECTPQELLGSYVSSTPFQTHGGLMNLLWFINILAAMNALRTIKQAWEETERGAKIFFSYILFYLYNLAFAADTLDYCLWISTENPLFQGFHLLVNLLMLLLAFPMICATAIFATRRLNRGNFAMILLVGATASIALMEIGYLTYALLNPYH